MFGIDSLIGLGTQALGGVADSLGWKLGQGLVGDDTSNYGSSPWSSGADVGWDMVAGKAPQLLGDTLSNAAGQIGQEARIGHEKAIGGLTNSAQAMAAANRLRSLGDKSLGAASSAADASRAASERGLSAALNNVKNVMSARGGPLAAVSRTASNMGQGAASSLMGAVSNSANQYNNALGLASRNTAQASGILNQDLANRNQIFVKPYETQTNQAALTAATNMAAKGGESAQTASQQNLTNPLSGLAGGLGFLGQFGLGNSLVGDDSPPGGLPGGLMALLNGGKKNTVNLPSLTGGANLGNIPGFWNAGS